MSKIRDMADIAYYPENILGTVSQTGGLPTGAIIERGSNANGSWTKFANGLMICTHLINFGANASTAWGALFKSPNYQWTYPVPFVSGTTPSCSGKSTNWATSWMAYDPPSIDGNIYAGLCILSAVSISGAGGLYGTVTAIGYWF